MIDWIQLFGGALLLYFGAEWFVGGASALALALRVPQILVGLTVVAYGTSAPEIVVGVQAARGGHGDVALGNVLGSNVANIGLTLGIAALIRPARVDGSLRRRELPVLVVSALLVPMLLLDGALSPLESAALLAGALLYTAWMVVAARSASALAAVEADAVVTREAADAAVGAPKSKGSFKTAGVAALGLGVLLFGGHVFVQGAVSLAHKLGMSERLVGLTIVAIGTSLPELITSIIAARRGHSDLAIGNVVGSNIFNVLLCLGAAGLAGTMTVPFDSLRFDLLAFVMMSLMAAIFIRTARTITRIEGAAALIGYLGFGVFAIARG